LGTEVFVSPNDSKYRDGTGSSGKSPTKYMKQPGTPPVPDKDWYRKWQEGLEQKEKPEPH
jgi:hypothetical protein